MDNVATPAVNGALPIVVVPSLKMIEPVGVPVPGLTAETWAVKVKLWPNTPGLADEVTVVSVLDWSTT